VVVYIILQIKGIFIMENISFKTLNLAISSLIKKREQDCLKWQYYNSTTSATVVTQLVDESLFAEYTSAIAELELYKREIMLSEKE
jgi:hypothetical protein